MVFFQLVFIKVVGIIWALLLELALCKETASRCECHTVLQLCRLTGADANSKLEHMFLVKALKGAAKQTAGAIHASLLLRDVTKRNLKRQVLLHVIWLAPKLVMAMGTAVVAKGGADPLYSSQLSHCLPVPPPTVHGIMHAEGAVEPTQLCCKVDT